MTSEADAVSRSVQIENVRKVVDRFLEDINPHVPLKYFVYYENREAMCLKWTFYTKGYKWQVTATCIWPRIEKNRMFLTATEREIRPGSEMPRSISLVEGALKRSVWESFKNSILRHELLEVKE